MIAAPLSRPLAVSAVPAEGVTVEIVADAAERHSLAAANEVQSVDSFTARLEAKPFGRDGVAVRGVVEAAATRLCVVSLEPFVERVREEIDVRFAPEGASGADAQSDDPPDPLDGGSIDLGAIAAEFFTLGLDLHPRKPGVSFEAGDDDATTSPFAALRGLSGRAGSSD